MSRPMLIAALACALAAPASANAVDLKLRALLNAGNVVSATESYAKGEARALLADDNDVRIHLVYANLEERATGAALHVGKPGENGALVAKLDLDSDEDSGRAVGVQFNVGAAFAARLRAGEAYLVITSIQHPDGVIRGQLLPQPVRLPEPPPTDH